MPERTYYLIDKAEKKTTIQFPFASSSQPATKAEPDKPIIKLDSPWHSVGVELPAL